MSSSVFYTRESPTSSGVTTRNDAGNRSENDSFLVPIGSLDDNKERVHLLLDSEETSQASSSEPQLFRRLTLTPLHSGVDLLPSDCPGPLLDAVLSGEDDDDIFFITTSCPRLFRFCQGSQTVTSQELELFPEHLRLEKGSALLSGWTGSGSSGKNLLLRVDVASGQAIARTRGFDVLKFGAFDTAPAGSSLWLASPSASAQSPDKAQLFELSADFRRKVHFVDLNSERQRLAPQFLACDDRSVFVSAVRTVGEEEEGRLLTFPAFPGPGETSSVKDWLSVNSWNFQALNPGRILALRPQDDSRRVLVLDRRYSSLHLVVWRDSELQTKPLCLPVRLEGPEGEPLTARAMTMGKRLLFILTEDAILSADPAPLFE